MIIDKSRRLVFISFVFCEKNLNQNQTNRKNLHIARNNKTLRADFYKSFFRYFFGNIYIFMYSYAIIIAIVIVIFY